jgi:hypothetical protein
VSISVRSITFSVRIGSFLKLFSPVDRIKKQIKGKINNRNNTILFFVKNFIYLELKI